MLKTRIFKRYLRWAYKKGAEDLVKLNFKPGFKKEDFTCLLCGVGSEQTANEFIRFVTNRNPRAKIWIIDLGEKQVTAVKKLVKERLAKFDVNIRRVNALELNKLLPEASLDWIETDGFLEYFDRQSLKRLLTIWHGLLNADGFITTRDFVSSSRITITTDAFRIWLAKRWLGVSLFRHTKKELVSLFKSSGFNFVVGPTPLPTYKRFTLVKRS